MYNDYATQGWKCPQCGRINAPFVTQCLCSAQTARTSQNTGDFRDYPRESQLEYFGKDRK